MKTLTQAELIAAFSYDPETGIFTGKRGYSVGTLSIKGYLVLVMGRNRYFAHRMAWLYVHGVMPEGFIDHINHVKTDNRISNLRVVSTANNVRYRKGLADKAVKAKGVRLSKEGTFNARIEFAGQRRTLGTFATADEAAHAYNKAAIATFGEFAVLNPVGTDK